MIRRAALRLAPAIDRLFVEGARIARSGPAPAPGRDTLGLLAEAAEYYGGPGRAEQLFAEPRAIAPTEKRVRPLLGGSVVDIAWTSGYEAVHPEHRRRLTRLSENRTARARWYRHSRPAPTILWAHGWALGNPLIEERVFPARAFYRLGFDVLLPTLPFHAARKKRSRPRPLWPSPSAIISTEATAQAVSDLRALVRHCLSRGAPAVGMSGMSLGGFTTSMMVTAEPRLSFAVPFIPFASVAELLWDHGDGSPARQAAQAQGVDLAAMERGMAAASPLYREPLITPDRILVVAGSLDHVTPPRYAEKLAQHFGDARLVHFEGAHLLQLGRSQAFRTILRFLRGLDLP
ncbi:MAG: alpha/beta hydrolase [Myxococcota bacterium]